MDNPIPSLAYIYIYIYSLTYLELIEKNENTNQWSATPGNAEAI
jgi:hypothetical protein